MLQVAEVRCKNDRITSIKLVMGSEIRNLISVYAPLIGLWENIKRLIWKQLNEVI